MLPCLPEHSHHGDDLPQAGGESNVLRFGRRHCGNGLHLGGPRDGCSCKAHEPSRARFGGHWVNMGIALSPVSDEVRVDPTIELPTFRRSDDQSFVSGTQEVPPYSFYCFGVTLFGVL